MFITIYERILQEHKHIEEQLTSIQSQINSFPSGKLQCQQNGKYHKWYCSDGHSRFHIPQKNQDFIKELASKEYLSRLSKDLSNEQDALTQYINIHNSHSSHVDELLNKSPQYLEYISSYIKPTLSDWCNEPYEHNTKHPEHLIYKASNGIYVRSKSEAIISMFLYNNQIQFRYECALHLNGITIYPDFTILHPKTGKIYYWEHFGKMDDSNYRKNVSSKLDLYISNKIYPFSNLITTYESSDEPLDLELVERLTQQMFL